MFGSFPVNSSPENTAAPVEENAQQSTGENSVQESAPEQEVVDNAESTIQENSESNDTTPEDQGSEEEGNEDNLGDKKPKKGFARRIEKFNQKLSQKEQEIEYWKNVALGKEKATPQVQQPVQNMGKPKFEEFDSIEAYTEALTDWKLSQTLNQVEQKAKAQQVAQGYDNKLNEFKKAAPDFDEVMSDFVEDYSHIEMPELVQMAYESDVGPQLAYHIAKNPQIVEQLAVLPSHRRLIELGKLEDKLQQNLAQKEKPKAEVKKVSSASKPVEPVKGVGKVETFDLSDPNLSYTEWVKRREAALKNRR